MWLSVQVRQLAQAQHHRKVNKGLSMQGKIVKGIAGFYYVHVVESGLYECKAKGIFRKEKMKPLVGDIVEIDILDETEKKGNIT